MPTLGICGGPALAAPAADAGFSFLEGAVAARLMPREPEAAFRAASEAWRTAPLPCPVLNCFVPADLKLVGPAVDEAALRDYVRTTMARAEVAGVDTMVFGSGGARAVPAGFDRHTAWRQLADFGRMAADVAGAHGVGLVVEPLQRRECNILNTVGEAAELVREVDHPALRLLVDAYHWLCDDDTPEALIAAGPLLGHAHIATRDNRRAPGIEPCDFTSFFAALGTAGFRGRLSIEARIDDAAAELPVARRTLAALAGGPRPDDNGSPPPADPVPRPQFPELQ